MSDDSNDNPPSKLKLSRDLKDQVQPEAPQAPPAMKLKRVTQNQEAPASAPSSDSQPADDAPPAPEAKPSFDLKNPFGDAIKKDDVIKKGEIQKPASPPPELASPPTPEVDDGSGAKLEEAISSLEAEEAKNTGKGSLMPSIIVILLLLLIVGGASYGLWKVLQPTGTSEDAATAAVADEAPAQQRSKNPIEKAKDAIAKVPVADVETITATKPTREPPQEVPDDAPPVATPPVATPPSKTLAQVAPSQVNAPTGTLESNKQSVSGYLSTIHIGGVRKGERPMILIEGERFLVGDVVHAETGLKFDGIREGRLAFRDSHGIVYLKSF